MFSLFCFASGETKESLRIGSFNLRGPFDPPPNDWANRAPRLFATLRKIDYDIFGTQESVEEYAEDICRTFNYQVFGHGAEPDLKGGSCRIFFRPDRLTLLKEETFWLGETPEKCCYSYGTTVPRIATLGVFEDKKTKKRFIFVNTHLQHMQMGETQAKQLAVIFKRLAEKYDPVLPVILTGDFNAYPEWLAPRLAASKLNDARLVSQTPPAGPQNETFHAFIADPQKRSDKERIDYIFVSPGITVKSFATIDNFNAEGLASSDHYPLASEILLP